MDEWLYEFHVGETVPGAEDPCYGLSGIGRAFCLDRAANPEKWAAWDAQRKAAARPRIRIPGSVVESAERGQAEGGMSGTAKLGLAAAAVAIAAKVLHLW